MNIDIFKNILHNLYSKEMCYKDSSDLWSKDNPSIGMCAITSLLVNDYFGYSIAKIKLDGISHYFNLFHNEVIDLTSDQFDCEISYDNYFVVSRDKILENPDTSRRYELLRSAFIEHMKNHFYMIPVDSDKYLPKYQYAVVTILKDKNDRFILQRRGRKARDEAGRLEEIGGAFEDSDITLDNAIKREIIEEVGSKATIRVGEVIGKFLNTKYDLRTNQVLNWLFVLYESFYEGGELEIAEPEKCDGYEFYTYDELPMNEMSESSKVFNEYYKNVRG